jgi:Na+/proline symporter
MGLIAYFLILAIAYLIVERVFPSKSTAETVNSIRLAIWILFIIALVFIELFTGGTK